MLWTQPQINRPAQSSRKRRTCRSMIRAFQHPVKQTVYLGPAFSVHKRDSRELRPAAQFSVEPGLRFVPFADNGDR